MEQQAKLKYLKIALLCNWDYCHLWFLPINDVDLAVGLGMVKKG